MTHRKTRQRFEYPNQLRFLTFSSYQRLQLFNNPRIRSRLVEQLRAVQSETGLELMAWVVMPEHVHLLVMPNLPEHPIDRVLDQLKGRFAKDVLARWRTLGAPILARLSDNRGQLHFWQAGGGYDRNIVSQEGADEKFNYIHRNPVARGLVANEVDWRWSSARWYAFGEDEWGLKMAPNLL